MTRSLEDLSAREVLALAIHVEQANAERMRAFAGAFRGYDVLVAKRFEELAEEEDRHEELLTTRFREKFGGEIPALDEDTVGCAVESIDLDDGEHQIFSSLTPRRVFELALKAEREAQEFYRRAAETCEDAELAEMYRSLAEMEGDHSGWLEGKTKPPEAASGEDVDFLFCPECNIHLACHRIPSGGWEVDCSKCSGECLLCKCYLKQYCIGGREPFPPPGSGKDRAP